MSKVSIIVKFYHLKAKVAQFDLAVKYVKINTVFHFNKIK